VTVPRPLLKVVAVLFLLVMAAYSAALIYYGIHRFPTASVGATLAYVDDERAMRVDHIEPGGPAERAGLRAGDRIVAVNGRALTAIYPYWDEIDRGQPGGTVRLMVSRPGDSRARNVTVSLDAFRVQIDRPFTTTQLRVLEVLLLFPLPFLVVAGVVLIQRFHDRHAWLLALMFASLISGDMWQLANVIHPALRKPLLSYPAMLALVAPGALYCFFASFPEPTPLDRRAPWLKHVLLGLPLAAGVLLVALTWVRPRPLDPSRELDLRPSFEFAFGIYALSGYGLGLASLAWSAFRARPETRRRTRVMLWGTVAGLVPLLILLTYLRVGGVRGYDVLELPFWAWVGPLLTFFLLPLSIAYAVVRHRVMELPVLLRRSARYVVVHRAIVTVGIVASLALTFFFASRLSRVLPYGTATAAAGAPVSAVAGAVFGVIVALATRQGVRKATERLDRAFFREAYDARRLLQFLARHTRAVTDRGELAALLEGTLTAALHPSAILVLLRTASDRLEAVGPSVPADVPSLDASAVDRESFVGGGATVVRPDELPASLGPLAPMQPELLVPMQGHDERLEGLLVLGPRLSEEPYSREDRELLASVASQAGTTLENLRLANAIAERIEAEKIARRELEIAREVQSKLLPQQAPALASLDYAGVCIQARQVGGDYYDFLYLGPGRLGLVLADISGKGISAALLMASFQASLRSQYAQAPDDLPRVLHEVNRTFFESTASSRYATLFFGIYDERSSRLEYANCGHPPPMLLSSAGAIDRLQPTGPAIGLFDEWRCTTREVALARQDTLVMFSDGVVEALNAQGQEFGEARLLDLVREQASVSSPTLVNAIAGAVQQHSGPALFDDLTLVVARGRSV
jgi:sigma-B regulation protein RsbU (phosphoserine phosphatase)